MKSTVWLGGRGEAARGVSPAKLPSAPTSPRRGGRPLAPPPPPTRGAPGAGAGRSLSGRILTSVQGRVIIGVCQRRGSPEPSQRGAARRQGGGGMKRGQDRKQSQQVTWQVLSELCNEAGECVMRSGPLLPSPLLLFSFFLSSREAGSSLKVGPGSTDQLF